MANEFPDWLNDFVTASFGEYQVLDPASFVQKIKDEQSLNQQNELTKNMLNHDDQSNVKGMNDQTGDVFEVAVKTDKKKNDKGCQIEFSSGKYKDKYLCSSIEDFCNGRYAHLKTQSLQIIAEEIAKDYNYIMNFVETSIASNSDSISIETALEVTNKIVNESRIADADYKKICSKLNYDDLNIYNSYIKNANIKVLAPVSQIEYYIDYIKNFKEYKIASQDLKQIYNLKNRIASIEKFRIIANELSEEFKKDSVLRNITLGE